MKTMIHPLDNAPAYSYVAVTRHTVELKIDERVVRFDLKTAKEICDILRGYTEDYDRMMNADPRMASWG